MKQEYIELVNEAKDFSINLIKHFYELLNLEPESIDYLYKIPTIIRQTYNDNPAEYLPVENCIIINKNEIEFMSNYLNQNPDSKEKVILNIAASLIHEMIHANRTILINNGLHSINLEQKTKDEFTKYIQEKNGHDLNQYRLLLSNILNKPYVSELKTYIPIKIKINEDKTYTIIAYNRQTKNYEEFANKIFNIKKDKDKDKMIYKIGIELNNNKYKATDIIKTFINKDNKFDRLVATDYYHPYSDSSRIIHKNELPENPSVIDFITVANKKNKEIKNRINISNGFEELLTETLAYLIIFARNKKQLNLTDLTNTTYKSPSSTDDVKIGSIFIQKMGIDTLKWFLTSAYKDYYTDEMEKTFQERYDDLLFAFNDIYKSATNEKKINKNSIQTINEIIEEKSKKTR